MRPATWNLIIWGFAGRVPVVCALPDTKPIYAYRCNACGFAKDVLQKMADPPLATCPQCGADAFRKQLTAAGFQLKGSGWYVTDFKGGNQSKSDSKKEVDGGGDGNSAPPAVDKTVASDGGKAAPSEAPAPKAAPPPASAPAPAAATPPPSRKS